MLMGLVANKLLLSHKNKPGFLENLVMSSTPSLHNIYNNVVRARKHRDIENKNIKQGFKFFIEQNNSLSYCNIELRPKGIIIHQNKRATRLSWIIPYYRLSIFHSDVLSFHCNGEFLKIKKDIYINLYITINKINSHMMSH